MRKKIKTVLGEIEPSALGLTSMDAVSYTHLDVYKRQVGEYLLRDRP